MVGINAYLTFNGNCREAMQFYQKCLGADLQLMTFGESDPHCPAGMKDRIMHARLVKGSAVLMASDVGPGMPFQQGINNFSISLNFDNAPEIEKTYAALSEGGHVTMALQETFWAARFGMLADRFGVNWMLNFEKARK